MKPTFPLAMLLVWLLGNVCVANHVLIVVGPDSHGPGSHEPIAGARAPSPKLFQEQQV